MLSDNFEKAFSDFLDRREYDKASYALFSIVRIAFTAGWLAAGGESPPPQKVLELIRPEWTAAEEENPSDILPPQKN